MYVYIYIYIEISLYIHNIYIWICTAVLDKLRHRPLQVALCQRLVRGCDCLELGEDRCCFLDPVHVELGLLDVLVLRILDEALAQLFGERSEHVGNL